MLVYILLGWWKIINFVRFKRYLHGFYLGQYGGSKNDMLTWFWQSTLFLSLFTVINLWSKRVTDNIGINIILCFYQMLVIFIFFLMNLQWCSKFKLNSIVISNFRFLKFLQNFLLNSKVAHVWHSSTCHLDPSHTGATLYHFF